MDPDALSRVQPLLEQVQLRFDLTPRRFAARVIELAEALAVASGASREAWADAARRLNLDDLYLATACAEGDERAWDEFGRRFFDEIRRVARRVTREPAASDVADQLIADLWQRGKVARYEGRSQLRTWLGVLVANAVFNATRASRRTVGLDSDDGAARVGSMEAETGSSAETRLHGAHVLKPLIRDALAAAAPEDQMLLLLYYEQGLTLEQMTTVFDASKATLSRRLQRVRDRLRETIETLARERYRSSAAELRGQLDLGRLEIDLGALLGRATETDRPGSV